jgi:hypothetical protein
VPRVAGRCVVSTVPYPAPSRARRWRSTSSTYMVMWWNPSPLALEVGGQVGRRGWWGSAARPSPPGSVSWMARTSSSGLSPPPTNVKPRTPSNRSTARGRSATARATWSNRFGCPPCHCRSGTSMGQGRREEVRHQPVRRRRAVDLRHVAGARHHDQLGTGDARDQRGGLAGRSGRGPPRRADQGGTGDARRLLGVRSWFGPVRRQRVADALPVVTVLGRRGAPASIRASEPGPEVILATRSGGP